MASVMTAAVISISERTFRPLANYVPHLDLLVKPCLEAFVSSPLKVVGDVIGRVIRTEDQFTEEAIVLCWVVKCLQR